MSSEKPPILDVTAHHGDIEEIRNNIVPWVFRPETYADQARMSLAWRWQRDVLHDRSRWSHERLMEWKFARLAELVDHAFTNVPLYREKYGKAGYERGALRSWADWEALPAVSREEVVAGFPDRSLSERFDPQACRWLTSSGSSGTPVQLVLEPLRAEMDQLHRFRMFESMTGTSLPPDRWVYNINHAHWWITSQCYDYPTFTVSQQASAAALAEHIHRMRPSFVSGISSAVEGLARNGCDLRAAGVMAVSTNSETTSASVRRKWERIFGVPVLDEYSSEEAGLLSYECPEHRIHLIEDDTHLDVVSPNDLGVGEVLTTDLWNRAMPFIRYQQGDEADTPSYQPCKCGVGFRTIKALEGRRDEAFHSPVTGYIAPGVLLALTDNLLGYDDAFAEYRVIQRGPTEIELVLVLYPGAEPEPGTVSGFTAGLEEVFGTRVNLEVSFVESLSGYGAKRRALVNRMEGAGPQ